MASTASSSSQPRHPPNNGPRHAARHGCNFVCTACHAVDPKRSSVRRSSQGAVQTAAGRCSPSSSLPESAARQRAPDLFQRHALNPILTAAYWPHDAHNVFNPGATLLPSGETLLPVRAEDHRGLSHLTVARSNDGISAWWINPRPTFSPSPQHYPEELWGVEGARIVRLVPPNRYAVTSPCPATGALSGASRLTTSCHLI